MIKASKLPWTSGLRWFGAGIHYFRLAPMQWFSQGMMLMFSGFLLSAIPFVGSLIFTGLQPFWTVGLFTTAWYVNRKLPFNASALFRGFRNYSRRLALPCFIHIVTTLLGILIVVISNNGLLEQLSQQGQQQPSEAMASEFFQSSLWIGLLSALLLNALVQTFLVFAGPLLAGTHASMLRLKPMQAIFFSAVGVWRNQGAFIVHGLCCMLFILLPFIVIRALFSALGMTFELSSQLIWIFLFGIFVPIWASSMFFAFGDIFHLSACDTTDDNRIDGSTLS